MIFRKDGPCKWGIIDATLSATKELVPQGVRVNAIAPGFIRTMMIEHIPAEIKQQRLASIAMARIGEDADVADVVLFLASKFSACVMAQVIGVDNGMVIR